jgi:hypothetical protein
MRCTELTLRSAASAIAAPVPRLSSALPRSAALPWSARRRPRRSKDRASGCTRAASCRVEAHPRLRRRTVPAPDAGLGLAGLTHDRVRPDALGAEQHNLRPPDMFPQRVAISDQRSEPINVGGRDGNGNPTAHPAGLHGEPAGNLYGDSNVRPDPPAMTSSLTGPNVPVHPFAENAFTSNQASGQPPCPRIAACTPSCSRCRASRFRRSPFGRKSP